MLAMFVISLAAALVLCCLLFPSVWATMACDELLDAHEAGLALVSTRKTVQKCAFVTTLGYLCGRICASREPCTRERATCLHGKAHHVEAQGNVLFSLLPLGSATEACLSRALAQSDEHQEALQCLAYPSSGISLQHCACPTTAQRSLAVRTCTWQAVILLKTIHTNRKPK